MTEMAPAQRDQHRPLTVGQVAARYGVTVRTLHHYDEIGMLRPTDRSPAGYRLYTGPDIIRLRHIVVYRRLGIPLEEIVALLDDPDADVIAHLRRQRATVMSRLDEMHDLVAAIERALEAEMSGIKLTKDEQRELFGDGYSDEYAAEARERWGDTDAFRQSMSRTSAYTKDDWVDVKAEGDEINAAYADALTAGIAPDTPAVLQVAERHRQHIQERFYDLSPEGHRNLADMYVADPRFTETYERIAPGLAHYVHDAIHANADRAQAQG
ncbi:MAG: MerR family transcriptional regulator [Mycobacteriales bacterium]